VEIKRDDLSVAGEEVMKRLQVRAGFQVALMDGSVRKVNIPAWLELVDTATGTTQGGNYYTGTVTVSSDGGCRGSRGSASRCFFSTETLST
jgi:hypothetical protein